MSDSEYLEERKAHYEEIFALEVALKLRDIRIAKLEAAAEAVVVARGSVTLTTPRGLNLVSKINQLDDILNSKGDA